MELEAELDAVEEKSQDLFASLNVEIKGAIDELKRPRTAIHQMLE